MKEVKEKRYAGPFKKPPFQNYVQSPIGLVPKADNKTRLIFHLSYDFGDVEQQKSVNHHIPDHICTVKYNDLDCAVCNFLRTLEQYGHLTDTLYYCKTDASSAFRVLPVKVSQRFLLVMKMRHPEMQEVLYFIDKCLPFDSSISCALYQAFSNALKHIAEWRIIIIMKIQPALTNYLDDFLFVAISIVLCNGMMQQFLWVCTQLNCPISAEKTVWATPILTFLGVLFNGRTLTLSVPEDKKVNALSLINYATSKKKVTVKFIQKLTGTLNFLNRVIVPGRAFTRGMYSHLKLRDSKGKMLKQFHHVTLNKEFLLDCKVWKQFLLQVGEQNQGLCRPFVDFYGKFHNARTVPFYSDVSKAESLGMGAVYENDWFAKNWPNHFIAKYNPSIEFLELYALTVAMIVWGGNPELRDRKIIIYCDNESVLHMVNNAVSSCLQCRKLLCILTLNSIKYNRMLRVRHVRSEDNILADSLSRGQMSRFWRNAPLSMNKKPSSLLHTIWPPQKIWLDHDNYLNSF